MNSSMWLAIVDKINHEQSLIFFFSILNNKTKKILINLKLAKNNRNFKCQRQLVGSAINVQYSNNTDRIINKLFSNSKWFDCFFVIKVWVIKFVLKAWKVFRAQLTILARSPVDHSWLITEKISSITTLYSAHYRPFENFHAIADTKLPHWT